MRAHAGRIGGGTRAPAGRRPLPMLAWLLMCLGAVVLAGLEFPPGRWFAELARPDPALPAGQLAALLLAVLALAVIGAWRIDRRPGTPRACALRLFLVQLALFVVWLAVLFGGHAIGPAVAVMAVLWLALVATAVAFSRLDRVAALLVLPYLAWATYAFQQNITLWNLNG